MKVFYISSATIPSRTANSIHVMKMAQAFKQQGHAVELLSPMRYPVSMEETAGNLWKRYGITDLFPIRWLPENKIFRNYDYALRAAFDAWKHQPDLVFTRNVPAATVTAWLGIPTICESHAPTMSGGEKWSLQWLIRAPGFQKLIVISQPMKTKFLQFIGPPERIHVFPDGVDLKQFEALPEPTVARQTLGVPLGKRTFGYAGHLYEGRGVELIFELAQNRPEDQFLIMGGTEAAIQNYARLAENQNLANLIFLGFIENHDLPTHLAACDILLMPYQRKVTISGGGDTAAWMSPLKMFEYMACRRVVIASDLPVLREVLNEQNSFLCDPSNPQEWLEAIEKVAQNPPCAAKIAKQAQQDVLKYSWQARVKAILKDVPLI